MTTKTTNGQKDRAVNGDNWREYTNSVRRRVSADLERKNEGSETMRSANNRSPVVSRFGSCEKVRPSSVLLN